MNLETCVNIPWSIKLTSKLVPLNHMAESHNDFFIRELTDALSTLRDGRVTLPEAPKKNGKMQLQNGEASKRYTVDL